MVHDVACKHFDAVPMQVHNCVHLYELYLLLHVYAVTFYDHCSLHVFLCCTTHTCMYMHAYVQLYIIVLTYMYIHMQLLHDVKERMWDRKVSTWYYCMYRCIHKCISFVIYKVLYSREVDCRNIRLRMLISTKAHSAEVDIQPEVQCFRNAPIYHASCRMVCTDLPCLIYYIVW